MTTKQDLYLQFHNETGHLVENYKKEYYQWLEDRYLERINEEEKLREFHNSWIEEELREYDKD